MGKMNKTGFSKNCSPHLFHPKNLKLRNRTKRNEGRKRRHIIKRGAYKVAVSKFKISDLTQKKIGLEDFTHIPL